MVVVAGMQWWQKTGCEGRVLRNVHSRKELQTMIVTNKASSRDAWDAGFTNLKIVIVRRLASWHQESQNNENVAERGMGSF